MSESFEPQMDFARRVGHFDVMEAADGERSDDEAERRERTSEDDEKDYLMGGGGRSALGDGSADEVPVRDPNACCARSCGGNDRASRVEGRNIVLGVTIVTMAIAGLLFYSSFQQYTSPNRNIICIMGMALSGAAELAALTGLVGLCRFEDLEKIPFKLGYWLHMILLWGYAAYMSVLLYFWDGRYSSGTLSVSSVSSTSSGTVRVHTAASLLELAAGAVTAASARETWFTFLGTQLWFMAITTTLILLNVLYLYGSLRLRCKRMGKWGTTMTAFILLCVSWAILLFAALTIRFTPSLLNWPDAAPLATEMAVAVLISAMCIYEMYVSTQVAKLKLAAKDNFKTLLIMALVSVVTISVSHYVYYQALNLSPRQNFFHLTAIAGIAAQILLIGFGVQLLAWRYALPDEYAPPAPIERFDENGPFLPVQQVE